MNILYMNQGGGGQWGALMYSNYDIILLAESDVEKDGFKINWKSTNRPVMSVQLNENAGLRKITEITDLDVTVQEVRPLVTFTLVGENIRVVFVHLKSASEKFATKALDTAIKAVMNIEQFGRKLPTLWIGDFNRANDDSLINVLKAKPVFKGGGASWWDLDRAYISGDWSQYPYNSDVPATAFFDHHHAAIGFNFEKL